MILEVSGLGWKDGEHRGTLLGPRGLELVPGVSRGEYRRTVAVTAPFSRLVASLNPEPWKVGCGLRLSARTRATEGEWSDWSSLGVYGSGRDLPKSEASGDVHVDTLHTAPRASEIDLRLEVEAGELGETPCLRRLALTTWDADDAVPAPSPSASGELLIDVPTRSQYAEAGDIAQRVCSPTSLAMVLEHWGHRLTTADVAAAVYDHGAKLYGNWSFNVAFAGTLGLEATVARLTFAALEAEIAAKRPVVISHRYGAGELSGAQLASTQGHLIVVVGFDADGDVVVNDPAADPGSVRRTYRRAELTRSWGGIAYVIKPRTEPSPKA